MGQHILKKKSLVKGRIISRLKEVCYKKCKLRHVSKG